MNIVDRILTVIITATLTSAVWIVAGGSIMRHSIDQPADESVRPAEALPSPDMPEVAGLNGDGSRVQSLDTDLPGTSDADAAETLMIPVLNVRASDLTDTFMDERGGGDRMHEAIDVMAPEGTTVVAAAPGRVEKLFLSDAGGKTIYVRSKDKRTIYYYAHLKEYAEGLQEGQRVRRGQRLGTVGSTGNASANAPHLHFSILRTTADADWWEPANAVNPYAVLAEKRPAS